MLLRRAERRLAPLVAVERLEPRSRQAPRPCRGGGLPRRRCRRGRLTRMVRAWFVCDIRFISTRAWPTAMFKVYKCIKPEAIYYRYVVYQHQDSNILYVYIYHIIFICNLSQYAQHACRATKSLRRRCSLERLGVSANDTHPRQACNQLALCILLSMMYCLPAAQPFVDTSLCHNFRRLTAVNRQPATKRTGNAKCRARYLKRSCRC